MINTMELKEGAGVYTPSDKQVGKISRFVVNPVTNEVTHLVVQKGWLFPEDKVVPLDMVSWATDDKVTLTREVDDDVNPLLPFEEPHYIRASEEDAPPYYYWYPAWGYYPDNGPEYAPWPVETTRNIPENTVLLQEGAKVVSSDGEHVGAVERLFVEPQWNRATHFVITQGILFKDHKLIPAHWVRSVEEDQVNLVVSAQFLKNLPSYKESSSVG